MTLLIFSNHAKQRLRERRIDETLVRRCITNPDKVLQDSEEKKSALKVNGKVLILVYKEISSDIFYIITAFESSKISRYL